MTKSRLFRPETNLNAIHKLGEKIELASHLRMEFTEMTDTSLSAQIKIADIHLRPGGIMSGGVSLALIETVGSVAGLFTIDYSTHNIFGIEVNANHVRQVKLGQVVVAKAEPEHIGRTTQIWNVKITCEEKLACTGRITLMIVPKD